MSNTEANPLLILRQIREDYGLSQESAAEWFGSGNAYWRYKISKWENWTTKDKVPSTKYRKDFIRYLAEGLELKNDRERFEQIWDVLKEKWKWLPLTDAERQQLFGVDQDSEATTGPTIPLVPVSIEIEPRVPLTPNPISAAETPTTGARRRHDEAGNEAPGRWFSNRGYVRPLLIGALIISGIAGIIGTGNLLAFSSHIPLGGLPQIIGHTVTSLDATGRILVVGGRPVDGTRYCAAKIYDPVTKNWQPGGDLKICRDSHTATKLNSDSGSQILVAGGYTEPTGVLTDAELYDLRTKQWTITGPLNTPHSSHTATLLDDGRVLVVGGNSNATDRAEVYTPATRQWTYTGSLHTPRAGHTATLLSNGKVLVVGGVNKAQGALADAELYDPQIGRWTPTPPPTVHRTRHTATLLSNGMVLVAGGEDELGNPLTDVEIYDSTTNSWRRTQGSLQIARSRHDAILLPPSWRDMLRGRLPREHVLVVGGIRSGDHIPLVEAEIYDVDTEGWNLVEPLLAARSEAKVAQLPYNGTVMIVAGYLEPGQTFPTAEIYDPEPAYHTTMYIVLIAAAFFCVVAMTGLSMTRRT